MHQIQSKSDNIEETVTISLKKTKKKTSITNKFFRKIPIKHKVKKNALQTQYRKIKVKSIVQGSTGGKSKGEEVRWRTDPEQACSREF